MKIDILLSNARVYDINVADIVKGEQFILEIAEESPAPDLKWFSDNDPALDITVVGSTAQVKATALGLATILIMNPSFEIVKTLKINVVDAIAPLATSLNPTVTGTELKKGKS